MVKSIRGIRQKEDMHEVLVRWVGFEDDNHEVWEPLDENEEDLPGKMGDYLYSTSDRKIKRELLHLY